MGGIAGEHLLFNPIDGGLLVRFARSFGQHQLLDSAQILNLQGDRFNARTGTAPGVHL